MNKVCRADRKLQIVESCLDLFANNGFAGTTSKQMAKASGVSEALIYKYFPTKGDIFHAVTKYCINKNVEVLDNLKSLERNSENFVLSLYVFVYYLASGYPGTLLFDKARHRLLVRGVCDQNGEFFKEFTDSKFVVWNKVAIECFDVLKSEGHVAFNSSSEMISMCQFLVSGYTLHQLPNDSSLNIEKNGLDLVNMIMLFSLRGMGMSENSIENLYNPLKFQNQLKKWADERLN